MFIELQTRPDGFPDGYSRTLLRSTSIVLIRESEKSPGHTEVVLDNSSCHTCQENIDEVFSRIQKAEASSNMGYSVTMEGNGFTTTTTGSNL